MHTIETITDLQQRCSQSEHLLGQLRSSLGTETDDLEILAQLESLWANTALGENLRQSPQAQEMYTGLRQQWETTLVRYEAEMDTVEAQLNLVGRGIRMTRSLTPQG